MLADYFWSHKHVQFRREGLLRFRWEDVTRFFLQVQFPFTATLEEYQGQLENKTRLTIRAQLDKMNHANVQLSQEALKDVEEWLMDNHCLFTKHEVESCYQAIVTFGQADEHTNPDIRQEKLNAEVRESFRRRLELPTTVEVRAHDVLMNMYQWSSATFNDVINMLIEKHFTFTDDQIINGYETYKKSFKVQKDQEKTAAQDWSRALARYPNLKAIQIGRQSRRIGARTDRKRAREKAVLFGRKYDQTYLERFYPGTLLRGQSDNDNWRMAEEAYLPQVIEAVSLANIAPERMLFLSDICISGNLQCDRIPGWHSLDLSNLRSLDFWSIGWGRERFAEVKPALERLLISFLDRTPALEDLRIKTVNGLRTPGNTRLPLEIVSDRLTNLKRLHLHDAELEVNDFAKILEANEHLFEVRLHTVSARNDNWRHILDSMRQHPSLRRVSFERLEHSRRGPMFFGHFESWSPDPIPVKEQTVAYIEGKGDWTDQLETAWRG